MTTAQQPSTTLSIVKPRITRHRNSARYCVAVFCEWLAHVLPQLSETNSGQLLTIGAR